MDAQERQTLSGVLSELLEQQTTEAPDDTETAAYIEQLQSRLQSRTQALADRDAELGRLRALLKSVPAKPTPSAPAAVSPNAAQDPQNGRRMTVLARIVEENLKLRMDSSDP
jgi:septal ring factor EnvC (AmiA/AmiB activator)